MTAKQKKPTTEEKMKNIIAAHEDVRTARRELKAAIEQAKDCRVNLKTAEACRSSLIDEAESGLPLLKENPKHEIRHPAGAAEQNPKSDDEQMMTLLVSGKKPKALAAIEQCDDLNHLQAIESDGLKGDWRRAAVRKRIEELEKKAAEDAKDAEADNSNTSNTTATSAAKPVGFFDIANPWPEGSTIIFTNGDKLNLDEVNLKKKEIVIRKLEEAVGATLTIDEWNEGMASTVEEVRFPQDKKKKKAG